jgi:hypothetical protein
VGSVQNGVTQGTDWATRDGSGNIVAYTGYTDVGERRGDRFRSDEQRAHHRRHHREQHVANTGVTDVNTVLFNGVGASAAATLNIGAGNTLRLGRFGGVFRSDTSSTGGNGGAPMEIGTTQNVGVLTAGGADNTPGEIVLTENASSETSGAVNVEAQVADNGTGAVTVIKAGAGSSKLRGT